jgi:hypothetical protein
MAAATDSGAGPRPAGRRPAARPDPGARPHSAPAPGPDSGPGAEPYARPGTDGRPGSAVRPGRDARSGPDAAAGVAPLAFRVAGGVLVLVGAAALAVIECFLVPLRVGTVPLPLCVPLAVAGNVVLARLAGGLAGRPLLGVLPPVLWLAVVLVLAAPRAEGDLIVPGTLTGLVFLFAGAVAGAYGAATTVTRGRKPTIAP